MQTNLIGASESLEKKLQRPAHHGKRLSADLRDRLAIYFHRPIQLDWRKADSFDSARADWWAACVRTRLRVCSPGGGYTADPPTDSAEDRRQRSGKE